jgi:hypothetical protein
MQVEARGHRTWLHRHEQDAMRVFDSRINTAGVKNSSCNEDIELIFFLWYKDLA